MLQNDTEGYTALAENPNAGDEKLHVTFHAEPVKNERRSAEEGRPIYDEVDYIRIAVPGDATNIIYQPLDEVHLRRFGRRYEAWRRNGREEVVSGTPLKAWPSITRAQVEELAHFNCRTVEQLAGMPDNVSGKFPGIQALKRKAADYLEAARGNAPTTQLRAELEARDAEMAAMKAQLAEMQAALAASASEAPVRRGPGRPPKVVHPE